MNEERKEHKKKFNHIRLDFEQMRVFYNKYNRTKAKSDNVGWLKAYLVYLWIFTWQLLTKEGYGRVRKQDVFKQIEQDLLEPKPHIVVAALIRAKMVTWGRSEYEGKANNCLQCTYLNEKLGNNSSNAVEVPTTVIESVLPYTENPSPKETESRAEKENLNGVYYYGGQYYYTDAKGNICRDNDGNIIYIPKSAAYCRPSIEHVFDFEVCQWRLPDEVTVRELEF